MMKHRVFWAVAILATLAIPAACKKADEPTNTANAYGTNTAQAVYGQPNQTGYGQPTYGQPTTGYGQPTTG